MIGPFDKPAELQIQPIPFELMFQLAEKQQARRDKSEQELGTLQGAFASLQEAPGHEDYKRKALAPYQDAIKNFMSKYSDPSDPRAIRELSALKSSFISDQHVQNIHNSKQTYDKLMPELYKAKQTDAVFTSPVMNKQGEFQPNEQLYTPSNLGFIPNEGKIDEEIDVMLRAKLPEISKTNGAYFTTIKDPDGNPRKVFVEQGVEKEFKNSNTFKDVIAATSNIVKTQSTGSSRHFVAKYGEDAIEPYIVNRTIPLYFDREKTDKNYQVIAEDKEDKTYNPFNTPLLTEGEQFSGQAESLINDLNKINNPGLQTKTKEEQKKFKYTSGSGFNLGAGLTLNLNDNPIKKATDIRKNNLLHLNILKIAGDLKIGTIDSNGNFIQKKLEEFTPSDYNAVNDRLKVLNESKVFSGIEGFVPGTAAFDGTTSADYAKDINVQLPQMHFYIPSSNTVIPGSKLGNDGDGKPIKIESVAGFASGNNPIPDKVSKGSKVSFSRPVQVKLTNGEVAYMGENFYNLNQNNFTNNPKAIFHYQATIQNAVTAAKRSGLIQPLSPGSKIYVIPQGDTFIIGDENMNVLGTGNYNQPVENYLDLINRGVKDENKENADKIYNAIFN